MCPQQPERLFTRSEFLRMTAGTVAAAAAAGSLSSSAAAAQPETTSSSPAPGSDSGADIDSLLDELDDKVQAAMQEYGIPGVALGLLYQGSEDASSAFQQAVQVSLKAPGGGGETVPGLGEEAFIGTSAQGGETHVGGGALYGDLIVNATLQGYDGTEENKAKVTELIRRQAAVAEQAL